MLIAPSAIQGYLNRKLRDSRKAKRFAESALDAKLAALDPPPRFHTAPRHLGQKITFLLGVKYSRYCLYLDMGVGKTWCALNLFRHVRLKAKAEGVPKAERPRMLTLVPGSHNVGEWAREAAKHVPTLHVVAADDRGEDAKWQVLEDLDVDGCVMTYAGFLRQVCKGKKQKDGSTKGWTVDKKKLHRLATAFQFIVFDECTQFGNNTSLTFRACRALSWKAEYVYALSGTPFGSDPKALWSIHYVVDKGETLGETLGLFRAAFYKEKDNFWKGWPDYIFDKAKTKQLRKMVRHNSIRYLITEVEDLPEPIRVVVPVEFNHENFQYYHRLLDELKEGRGSFRMVENTFTRLRSLTAGWLAVKLKDEAGVVEEDDVEVVFKHNPKLDAVMEDLKLVPAGAKAVIFHWYKKSGDLICERLQQEKIRHARLRGAQGKKASEVVERFLTDPKVNVLVSSSAGAYGGNWQAATYMFMFESPTDPKLRAQEERRIWRIGQTKTCVYRDYVVTGSVDEKILKAVGEGRDLLRDVMEGGAL